MECIYKGEEEKRYAALKRERERGGNVRRRCAIAYKETKC
jgi:hypothetical protein